jgi:RecB family exonuclease
VLWLRTLDVRLLRALSNHIKEVKVEFAITPGWSGLSSLLRLVDATEKALLASPKPDLKIDWQDLRSSGGPLKDLMASHLDPSVSYDGQAADRVELVTAAGRYGLAEEMVIRAHDAVKEGAPPHEVALVFPDLDVYGPMVADAARRLGLPLNFSGGMPLGRAPLVHAILGLLELPLVHYERRALANVWASPYLREQLERACLGAGEALPKDVGHLLKHSGYLDSRDVPLDDWLERTATREEGREDPNLRLVGDYRTLAKACKVLKEKLLINLQYINIKNYCETIIGLVEELGLGVSQSKTLGGLTGSCTPFEAIKARDLSALNGFLGAVRDIAAAADQAGADENLTPGRLLALLREVLNQRQISQGSGTALGVSVHRLADTMGVRPRVVLLGGLNQGEFPIRPQGQNLLSSDQRIRLGRKARRPVWRADEEEYEGQLLQLAWLLANCSERAVLGAAGSNLSGRQQAPSFVLQDLARLLRRELPQPSGGVFGELPQMDDVLETTSLWGRLTASLLRPNQLDKDLAQATLWHLSQKPEQKQCWQELAARSYTEEKRNDLNMISLELRAGQADAFNGCLSAEQAHSLLKEVLSDPKFRELSPSALETYAACPLAWYFSYLLKLRVLSEPGWALEARSEGDWVHRALAEFFKPEEFDPNWDSAAQAERLERCLDQAKLELSAGLASPPAVWEARYEVLRNALKQVVAREMAAMDGVLPWKVEEEIGEGFLIPVDEGPPLSLKGRLDRLDHGPQQAVITDYKHTSNEAGLRDGVDKEQAGVSQFQLPVYLAAAMEMTGGDDKELTGRLVPTLLASRRAYEMTFVAGDSFFAKDPIIRGQMAEQGKPNLFNAIAELWRRLASGNFVALPDQKTCEYCDFRLACRALAPNADAEAKAQA